MNLQGRWGTVVSVREGPELDPLTAARRELCRAMVELVQGGLGDPVHVRRLRGKVLRLKRRKGAKSMAWKVLRRPVARTLEPVITLNKNGILTWSPPIDAAMGEPARIEVLYDSQSQRLGIRAATGEEGIDVRRPKRLIAVKGML